MARNSKNPGNAGRGRRKGSVNRATANAREAIARFVDGNADKLDGWLKEIAAKDGPKAAFQCFCDVVEYHVPKLARTELTGKDGAALLPKVLVLEKLALPAASEPTK